MIMVGDTFHNFVDGVLIAAAFMEDVRLGIVTALAMIAHEIPQEVGDFVILLHSGYSKGRALAFNLLSSLATLVGALLAYVALGQVQSAVPVLLALAAASMIYVAVAVQNRSCRSMSRTCSPVAGSSSSRSRCGSFRRRPIRQSANPVSTHSAKADG
jgi:hypothetical protein